MKRALGIAFLQYYNLRVQPNMTDQFVESRAGISHNKLHFRCRFTIGWWSSAS